jgi:hypothetical protein
MLAVSQTQILNITKKYYFEILKFLEKKEFTEDEKKIVSFFKKFRFLEDKDHDKEELRLSLNIAKTNVSYDKENKYYLGLLNNLQKKWNSLYGKLC